MADESKNGALKISSREELESWLESLPPEQGRWVAVAIAARAVLRSLPFLALTQWTESAFTHHVSNHTLPAFLASAPLLATHFPLENEEKFAEISVDEEKATGDALVRPIKDVAEKMNDVVESGLASENIGKTVNNSAQFASDIAPLPPDASASESGSRRVTLKRRYVLGTLGFLVALYNLLGSTASILATEQGAALFEAVRKAIEALSQFLA